MMTQGKELGVLLLSSVRHQRNYAPVFAAHPQVRIVALADEPGIRPWMRAANQEFAAAYNVPYLEDVDAAVARADVDFVSVCSEPTRHARLAIRAARAGKHLWVDKPIAVALDECDELIRVVDESGVKCTFVHRLFSPAVQHARTLIDQGRVGLPRAFHMDFITAGGLDLRAVERFDLVVDTSMSGGGELINFLNYPLGYIRYLSGLEFRSVYATCGTFFFEPHREYGVEDLGVVCVTLERDVIASITVGRVPTESHPAGGDFILRVHGSHGMFELDELRPRLEIYGSKPEGITSRYGAGPGGPQGMTRVLLDHFLGCILEDRAPLFGPRDGRAIQEVIVGAYRSAATNQVVDLPLT